MEATAGQIFEALAAFGPEWIITGVVVFGIIVISIKGIPAWQKTIEARIEIQKAESEARRELELRREERKEAEEASREQRDRERSEMEGRWIAQDERAIIAMEKSNVFMDSLSTQLELMNERLSDSKGHSADMHKVLENVSDKVDDIHREIVR